MRKPYSDAQLTISTIFETLQFIELKQHWSEQDLHRWMSTAGAANCKFHNRSTRVVSTATWWCGHGRHQRFWTGGAKRSRSKWSSGNITQCYDARSASGWIRGSSDTNFSTTVIGCHTWQQYFDPDSGSTIA